MKNIQIRLWNDCINNCSFCSIKNKKHTDIESKKIRINKILDFKNYNRIGIIGGEFFEGQLIDCEEEWLSMIKNISCNELFITANLINEQYLLKETLNINKNILICTSYDSVGRFKNNDQKNKWLKLINDIDNVFCTFIPTQDVINDSFFNKLNNINMNICEPHLGIEWYLNIDKDKYHDILLRENKIFNLPKRSDFLKWIISKPNIIKNAINYNYTHFNKILSFDNNNNIVEEVNNRFFDKNLVNKCGHQYFSQCYSDSDRCMLCDLEEIF